MSLTKIERELAEAMFRRMPVESCHHGRGWGHSAACFRSCYSSWNGDVNEIARVLRQNRKNFDIDSFLFVATHMKHSVYA